MRYASFKKSRNIHVYLLLDIYLINKDHCDEAAKRLSFHLYAQILPRRSRFRRNRVKIPFGSHLVTVWKLAYFECSSFSYSCSRSTDISVPLIFDPLLIIGC